MRMLVLAPDSPEARQNDFDLADALGRHGGATTFRMDPEVAYTQGGMPGLERAVVRQIEQDSVDVLLYALGTELDFDPRFFGRLERVYRILMLGDDEHYFDVLHRYYVPFFDMVLTTNPDSDRLGAYGPRSYFLPPVFDPRIYNPGVGSRKEYDVSFVGAMHGKVGRGEYARALGRAGIELRTFGAGTSAGFVTSEKVVEIYRRSRINLNFTGGALRTPLQRDPQANRSVRQLKGRTSKVAMCGSFVLSEHAPGIERVFEVGREIDVFRDETELVDKVRFYIANEALREDMAARARMRALQEYDEAKFWPKFVNAVEMHLREPRNSVAAENKVPLDRAFWAAFGAWRFKYLVVFFFAGRFALLLREIGLLASVGRPNASAAVWFAAIGLAAAERTSRLAAALRRSVQSSRRLIRRAHADG